MTLVQLQIVDRNSRDAFGQMVPPKLSKIVMERERESHVCLIFQRKN